MTRLGSAFDLPSAGGWHESARKSAASLACVLAEQRKDHGLSVRQMAAQIGVSPQTVINLESGGVSSTWRVLARLAFALDYRLTVWPELAVPTTNRPPQPLSPTSVPPSRPSKSGRDRWASYQAELVGDHLVWRRVFWQQRAATLTAECVGVRPETVLDIENAERENFGLLTLCLLVRHAGLNLSCEPIRDPWPIPPWDDPDQHPPDATHQCAVRSFGTARWRPLAPVRVRLTAAWRSQGHP